MPGEGYVPVPGARLYHRDVGQGLPIIVVHGGPDFDHTYLLPDMDRLADSFRLVYYDQRGRGRSAEGVRPEDVTLESEIRDLDALREFLQLQKIAVLGHSWGGVLALAYALRAPDRLTHLIVMDGAPASHGDIMLFREERQRRFAADLEIRDVLAAGAGYQAGDPDAVAAYYRVHFRPALVRPDHLEQVISTLRTSFTREGILKARAIEDRLMAETFSSPDYDLFSQLRRVRVPTLVLHGDSDFIPIACAAHIAETILGARLVVVPDAGHFPYLERPEETRRILADFLMH